MAALQKNILEHISLMAQEQVQLEFVEELQEVQMIQQQMQAAGAAKSCNGARYDAKSTSNAGTTTSTTDYKPN